MVWLPKYSLAGTSSNNLTNAKLNEQKKRKRKSVDNCIFILLEFFKMIEMYASPPAPGVYPALFRPQAFIEASPLFIYRPRSPVIIRAKAFI